jgi:hypothetical protein
MSKIETESIVNKQNACNFDFDQLSNEMFIHQIKEHMKNIIKVITNRSSLQDISTTKIN